MFKHGFLLFNPPLTPPLENCLPDSRLFQITRNTYLCHVKTSTVFSNVVPFHHFYLCYRYVYLSNIIGNDCFIKLLWISYSCHNYCKFWIYWVGACKYKIYKMTTYCKFCIYTNPWPVNNKFTIWHSSDLSSVHGVRSSYKKHGWKWPICSRRDHFIKSSIFLSDINPCRWARMHG